MPRLSKIGAAALAAFGWTGLSSVTASYLVVAGGGGGGGASDTPAGGGGGAGGLLTGTTSLNPTLSYTVTVGAAGAGGSSVTVGNNGSNSVFNAITSIGGGGGGTYGYGSGVSGGSGGGAAWPTGYSAGAGTAGQGNAGGKNTTSGVLQGGGGGGGAGAVGTTVTGSDGGAGGAGTASSITGSSVTYAGGGGGGAGAGNYPTYGTGGTATGGGGSGGNSSTVGANGNAGTANLGGGGGGAGASGPPPYTARSGGNGGSGVVIISYVGAQQFGGGVVTSAGGNTIHTFTTSGTLSPLSSLTASYLIVAGGGGGGGTDVNYNGAGGGGAGGLLSGSSLTIDTNSIYAVSVGAGGAGGTVSTIGANGNNSNFSIVSTAAVGGGGGGSSAPASGNKAGANGGSGGGGSGDSPGGISGGTGTSGQGNAGGSGFFGGSYGGGGGGGAFAAGQSASAASGNGGGNGGNGTVSSISGSSVTYAGGGGGGMYSTAGTGNPGTGGTGGGGNGGTRGGGNGFAGTANLGGGGGGATTSSGSTQTGGNGGSGVVIISYPGSTQQMAGGTVTVAGGNVIHTFTSSGYLTPIVLVTKSLRFRSSASATLSRTPTTVSNRKTWTWSGWVKRGALGSFRGIFTANYPTVSWFFLGFGSGNTLDVAATAGSSASWQTTALFRDPSAWYHVVLAVDTTSATSTMNGSSTDRFRLYVNGTQYVISGGTVPSQNADLQVNNTVSHTIGGYSGEYLDGYLTEVNFIDGQALTPNSFGTFNGLGVWQPIRYGGSYGTNGFYLPFTNTTSTTTLVADSSPNGNNWTPNNISLTSGSTYDSMNDVPTLTSATTANYCVFNPLDRGSTNFTLSNGNLNIVGASASSAVRATMAVSSGKWYWEATPTAIGNGLGVGFAGDSSRFNPATWNAGTYVIYQSDGNKHINGSASSYGATYTTNDVIGVALDMDAGTITFYKNNVSQGTASTGLTGVYLPVFSQTSGATTGTINANFGAGSGFAYTPPTGFVALNTYNLPTPTIGATASTTANKYMDATLYTGTGASLTVTNSGSMQPDFVWFKNRSNVQNHHEMDSVRGGGTILYPNLTNSEDALGTSWANFTSTGFSIGASSGINNSGQTFVAWQWRASNAAGVSNTQGTITSTVSANTTAGFSVVTYTGNNTSGATVGHGLGVVPAMVICKNRTAGIGSGAWPVWHKSLTGGTYYLFLNTTAAQANTNNNFTATPTSTVLNLGTSDTNNTATMVAYCFAEVAGYSAFGSYTGNGSTDGPFVFTEFRPRFVIIKSSTFAGADWVMYDSARNTYNALTSELNPNTSGSENNFSGAARMDFVSNGIKIRTSGAGLNNSGSTYIYMAFAENPFKYANAR